MKTAEEILTRVQNAAEVIREKCGEAEIGMILGSGLAKSITLEEQRVLDYRDIPDFPFSTVPGHINEWVGGTLHGKKICMMRGRFHAYEGYSSEELVLPVRVMKLLGVKTLIVTNAAGGINRSFQSGDLMLMCDHINFSGINPLAGPNIPQFGERFPDLSNAYDRQLQKTAHSVAEQIGIKLKEGVYMWMYGPSYETPAEVRMCAVMGADAVGMSTVPEVIVANQCGMRVLGISLITNLAAGISDRPLDHREVLENGEKGKEKISVLLDAMFKENGK